MGALGFLLRKALLAPFQVGTSHSKVTVGIALPVVGVGVGVFAFTVVLSVMGGFVHTLKTRLLRLEPHLEIVVREGFGSLTASPQLAADVQKALGDEVLVLSPFLKGDVILKSARRPATGVLLGVDPRRGSWPWEEFLSEGIGELRGEHAPAGNPKGHFPGVILGRELLATLEVDTGDVLTLIATTEDQGPLGLLPRQIPVVVVDILSTGSAVHDSKWAIVNMETAARFLDGPGTWGGLSVRLRDPFDAPALAAKADGALASLGVRAKPWTEANTSLLRAFELEHWGMGFVLLMVILVGCFSISITLVLMVKRKTREIALLRAMGLSRRTLGGLYLAKGLVTGAAGVVLGIGGGLGALGLLASHQVPLLSALYGGRPVPVRTDYRELAYAAAGSLVCAVVASLWPMREALALDVVQVLGEGS